MSATATATVTTTATPTMDGTSADAIDGGIRLEASAEGSGEVEAIGDENRDKSVEPLNVIKAQEVAPITTPRRVQMTMPTLADLSTLTLHSPSSQIIGTPFATTSTPFEYPFPVTPSPSPPPHHHHLSHPSSSSSLSAAYTSHSHSHSPQMQINMAIAMNTNLPPPLASESAFPAISTSVSISQISAPVFSYPPAYTLSYALPVSVSAASASSLSSSTASATSSPQSHPKLKTHIVPPIPPSLVKKSTRWSLGLVGRRKSNAGSAGAGGAVGSVRGSASEQGGGGRGVADGGFFGPMVDTPLGSPREEQGMR